MQHFSFKISKYSLCLILLFSFVFSHNLAFSYSFFFESFVALEDNKVEFFGSEPGGQFGASVASGDFNGDGVQDLITGAPFMSSNQKEWNGEAYIVFGDSSFSSSITNFSQIPPDLTVTGYSSGDQLGTSLTSGDYNNDGIDDVVVGVYNAAASSNKRPGKVYIYYGESTWGNQGFDYVLGKPDVLLAGDDSGDNFGLSLTTRDLDNDGVDDLLVGAPSASTPEKNESGVVYIYSGSSKGISSLFQVAIYGEAEGERFGSSISSGDINGDGNADVIVGAYFADSESSEQVGKVYIYDNIDFTNPIVTEPSVVIEGKAKGEWFSFSLDSGDVNGDQIDDLAVSSFPYNGDRSQGKVSVYYGGEVFDKIPDVVVAEPVNESMMGASVLLEDLDLDDRAEIIIGAPGIGNSSSTDEGDVYIVYSEEIYNWAKFSVKDKEVTSIIHGENADDWFGYGLDALDFNGDGHKDLVVGSRYADLPHSNNNGKVSVLWGDSTPFGQEKEIFDSEDEYITRGELINIIVGRFDLKNKKSDFIRKCYEHRDFCFFNFLTMSSYDVQLDPDVLLYPDIPLDYKYYEDVTIGTMLGLINGYLNNENSPFYPENSVSRIQALKIVLGAADAVPPKYRFELINILGSLDQLGSQFSYFSDVDAKIDRMWWYPRYVNFAVESYIVDKGEFFRPDEMITKEELDDMIERALKFINSQNEEAESSGDSEIETDSFGN